MIRNFIFDEFFFGSECGNTAVLFVIDGYVPYLLGFHLGVFVLVEIVCTKLISLSLCFFAPSRLCEQLFSQRRRDTKLTVQNFGKLMYKIFRQYTSAGDRKFCRSDIGIN